MPTHLREVAVEPYQLGKDLLNRNENIQHDVAHCCSVGREETGEVYLLLQSGNRVSVLGV